MRSIDRNIPKYMHTQWESPIRTPLVILCIVGMLKNSHKVAIHNLESTVSKKVNEYKKIRKFSSAYATMRAGLVQLNT